MVLTVSYSRPNDVQNATSDTVFVTQSPYYKFIKHILLILLITFIKSLDWLRTYVFKVRRGTVFWYKLHYKNIQRKIHSFRVWATIIYSVTSPSVTSSSVTSPNVCDTWTQFAHLELFGTGNKNLHELLHLPSISWRCSNTFWEKKFSNYRANGPPIQAIFNRIRITLPRHARYSSVRNYVTISK